MNPAQWLVRTALLTPQAPALFKGARLEADYAEFLHRVAALAGGLRAQYGISKCDRVAVFMIHFPLYTSPSPRDGLLPRMPPSACTQKTHLSSLSL